MFDAFDVLAYATQGHVSRYHMENSTKKTWPYYVGGDIPGEILWSIASTAVSREQYHAQVFTTPRDINYIQFGCHDV